MARRVIFFNGPPRSGKDTAVDYLVRTRLWAPFRMSQPLKDAVHAFYGLDNDAQRTVESFKDAPFDVFFHKTYRQEQISLSEDWAKQRHGDDVFGQLAARRVAKMATHVALCSDSGFAAEAEPILKLLQPGHALLVRVHRKDCTFDNDSRSYITLPDVATVDVMNHTSLAEYHNNIDTVVDGWLSQSEK